MSLLIFEPEVKGHFLALYVRSVIREYKNQKIFLATSKVIKNTKVLKILKKECPNLKIIYSKNLLYPKFKISLILFIYQILNFVRIRKIVLNYDKKYNFKHIFFSNLDYFDKGILIFNNPFNYKKFSGILVNPRVHQFYNQNNLKYNLYKIFLKSLLKNKYLTKIFSNDLLFYNFSKKKFRNNKILYFNEPIISEKKNSKKFEFLYNNLTKILVYGSIRNSKSLIELIHLSSHIENLKVIVAGKQESDVKTILSKKNLKDHNVYEKFKILNRFIEPEEEKELFLNTDYVWCVYKNTPLGSSGVFHLSCNYKKPVITNNDGLLGWYNRKYLLGPICNFETHEKTNKSIKLISRIIKNKKKYLEYTNNLSFLLKRMNRQKKFKEQIKNLF